MSAEILSRASGLWFAWLVVFLASVASGVVASFTSGIVWFFNHYRGLNAASTNVQHMMQHMMEFAVYGSLGGAAVGLFSATICAPMLMRKPRREVLHNIMLVSLIVGPLSSPYVWIFCLLLVLLGQVIVSVFMFAEKSPSTSSAGCTNCTYSLAGLDRSKTRVCPECGEPLPPLPRGEGGDEVAG